VKEATTPTEVVLASQQTTGPDRGGDIIVDGA
jgi:hypothetical protein